MFQESVNFYWSGAGAALRSRANGQYVRQTGQLGGKPYFRRTDDVFSFTDDVFYIYHSSSANRWILDDDTADDAYYCYHSDSGSTATTYLYGDIPAGQGWRCSVGGGTFDEVNFVGVH